MDMTLNAFAFDITTHVSAHRLMTHVLDHLDRDEESYEEWFEQRDSHAFSVLEMLTERDNLPLIESVKNDRHVRHYTGGYRLVFNEDFSCVTAYRGDDQIAAMTARTPCGAVDETYVLDVATMMAETQEGYEHPEVEWMIESLMDMLYQSVSSTPLPSWVH